MVWLVTFLNAFGGLVVAVVIKYADNIKKTYCQTMAIGLIFKMTAKIFIYRTNRLDLNYSW